MAKKNVGSSFDEFLEEEGLFEEATAAAAKRVIAFQLAEKMSEHSLKIGNGTANGNQSVRFGPPIGSR